MAKKLEDRIYTRERGGELRYYGDFRDYSNVGGSREALRAPGALLATSDAAEALRVAKYRHAELERLAGESKRLGLDPRALLEPVAADHLVALRDSGKYSESWIEYSERCMERALDFFQRVQPSQKRRGDGRRLLVGPRNLATISPPDVKAFMAWLAAQPNGRGSETLGPQSVRHHLNVLAAVFDAAIGDGYLEMGKNPVAAVPHKPQVPESTTELLEVDEVALLIESARTYKASSYARGGRKPHNCLYELLATYALTGARDDEVCRLDVRDLHFETRRIRIRGTKTRGSDRIIPMHPQLYEILHPYVKRLGLIGGLAFTSERTGGKITDWRKALDRVAARVGFEAGAVRTRRFRVSYATFRCTCDNISANEVRLELGHSSLRMMETVYARAQLQSRRMGPVFEYRLTEGDREKHAEVLARIRAA